MSEKFNIKKVVPLMLSVADIQPYNINNRIYPYDVIVSNDVGMIKNCVSDITFNINLENLLGNLYNEFDFFNIEIVQFMTTAFTGGGNTYNKPYQNHVNTGYQNLNVFIGGLNFIHSTFKTKTGNESNYAHIGNVSSQFSSIDNNSSGDQYQTNEYLYYSQKSYMNNNLCFKKEKNVKLNIRFGAIDSGLDYAPSNVYVYGIDIAQHFCIKFNIIPFK